MKRNVAAKGRRTIALLLLLVMCLGNITPALASEISEAGAAVYSQVRSGLDELDFVPTPASPVGGEAGQTDDEDSTESEDGADDEDPDGAGSTDTDGEESSEDQEPADTDENPGEGDLEEGDSEEAEGSEGSEAAEGNEDGEGEEDQDSQEPEDPEELEEPDEESLLLAAAAVEVNDLDQLIGALGAGHQEIQLKTAIDLSSQADAAQLNEAIADLTGEVVIVAAESRHFIISGDVEELVLGDLVTLHGDDVAGGLEIQFSAGRSEEFLLSGGVIQNCQAEHGGAIKIDALNKISIEQTQFNENSVSQSGVGSAIYWMATDSGGILSLDQNRFHRNDSTNGVGGTVHVQAIEINIENTDFVENRNYNGALFLISRANLPTTQLQMEGGTFVGNTAIGGNGGAVYAYTYTTGSFAGVEFRDNTAAESHGGAIYIDRLALAYSFTSCVFQNNITAGGIGGAIAKYSTNVMTVEDCVFESNKANISGGAIANSPNSGGGMTVTGSTFTNNETIIDNGVANSGGGAIYSNAMTTIIDSQFIGNRSAMNGGAVSYGTAARGQTLQGDLVFADNEAAMQGGAIHILRANLSWLSFADGSAVEFQNNVANGAYRLTESEASLSFDPKDTITSLSLPFDIEAGDSALNNYDISYTNDGAAQYRFAYHPNQADTGQVIADIKDAGATIALVDAEALGYDRDQHRFIGWNTAADGSGDDYEPGQTVTLNGNLTLYAQWVELIDVTFYWNHPDYSAGTEYLVLTRPVNSTIKYSDSDYAASGHPTAPIGFRFGGWNTNAAGDGTGYGLEDDTEISLGETALSLYGQWVNQFDLQFFLDPDDTEAFAELTIFGSDTATAPVPEAREGYRFAGWYQDLADESSKLAIAEDGTFVPEGDYQYYAKWIKTLTVLYFYADETPVGSAHTDYYEDDETVTIRSYPTQSGKFGRVWSTTSNGAGGTEYSANQTFTPKEVPELHELKLYLQWTELTDHTQIQPVAEPIADFGTLAWYQGTGGAEGSNTYFTMLAGEEAQIQSGFQVALGSLTTEEEASETQPADVYLAFNIPALKGGGATRTVAFAAPTELAAYAAQVDSTTGLLTATLDQLLSGDVDDQAAYADLRSRGFADDAVYLKLAGKDFAAINAAVGETFTVTATELLAADAVQFAAGVAADSLGYELAATHHTVNLAAGKETATLAYSFLEAVTGIVVDHSYDLPDELAVGDRIPVTITIKNLSNIGLEQVSLAIYKGDDNTASLFDTIGAKTISRTDSEGTTAELAAGNTDNPYLLGSWLPEVLNPANAGEDNKNGVYTIAFDYVINQQDLQTDENGKRYIPFFVEATAQTPAASFSQAEFAGSGYWYDGASLKVIDSLTADSYHALRLDDAAIVYHPNGADVGSIYTVGELLPGTVHMVLDNDSDLNLQFAKQYHTFLGWALTTAPTAGEVLYNAGDSLPVENGATTLYARWSADTYRVTYHANHAEVVGDDTHYDENDYEVGATVYLPENSPFAVPEYELAGWSVNADDPEEAWLKPGDPVTMAEFGLTLYAQWQQREYDVTYYVNHPEITEDADAPYGVYTDPIVYTAGAPITLLSAADAGFVTDHYLALTEYDFLGWSLSRDGAVLSAADGLTMASGGQRLYAIWQQRTYTITYNRNWETPADPVQVTDDSRYPQGEMVTLRSEADFDSDFWIAEHDLAGFSYDPDGTEPADWLIPGQLWEMPNENVTLYAQWVEKTYHVTYRINHEKITEEEPGYGIYVDQDQAYAAGANVVRLEAAAAGFVADNYQALAEYDFLGWSREPGSALLTEDELVVMESGGITLYGNWQQRTYNVTYDKNDGSGTTVPAADNPYQKDETVIIEDLFQREGHTFLGYSEEPIDNDLTQLYIPGHDTQGTMTMPGRDVTLYAQWAEHQYYLRLAPNGGAGEEEVLGPFGAYQQVELPENTYTREGYVFIGWSTAAAGDDGDNYLAGSTFTMPDGNAVLYARWRQEASTTAYVTYHKNDGSTTVYREAFEIGESHWVLDNELNSDILGYTRAEYEFGGWNSQADGQGITYTANAELTVTGWGLDLYAVWIPKTYGIQYDSNDAWYENQPAYQVPSGGSTVDDSVYAKGETVQIQPNGFTQPHYRFTGWNTEANGSGQRYQAGETLGMASGGMTLYAQWSIQQYTVTYDKNHEAAIGATVDADSPYLTGAEVIVLASGFSLDGYTFLGWNTQADGRGQDYQPSETVAVEEADIVLYAQWQQDLHQVRYYSNFQSGSANVTYVDAAGPYAKYTVVEVLTTAEAALAGIADAGYTLTGFNTQADGHGAWYAPSGSLEIRDEDVDLYAQWLADGTEPEPLTVTYKANGADGDPVDYQAGPYTSGQSHQILANENAKLGFAKEDNVFSGWNTQADGRGTWYEPGEELELTYFDVELYAQWELERWPLVYNANHPQAQGTMAEVQYALGAEVAVADSEFTLARHSFIGWSDRADGNDPEARWYVPGDTQLGAVTMIKNGLTLYAQWEENTFRVYYDGNHSDVVGTTEDLYEYPEDYTVTVKVSEFSVAGHYFVGWNTQADGSGSWLEEKGTLQMPGRDVTLYAQWKAEDDLEVTITYDPGIGGGSVYTAVEILAADQTARHTVLDAKADVLNYSLVNYAFAGWNTAPDNSGDTYQAADPVDVGPRGLILYAQWEKVAATVTYEPNGADGAPLPYADGGLPLGSSYLILANSDRNLEYNKAGFAFLGWHTDPLADPDRGSWYQPGQTVADLSEDLTLYAIFAEQTSSAAKLVRYDANTAGEAFTGSVVDGDNPYLVNDPSGRKPVVLANQFAREGYTFTGWNTNALGTGASYQPGDTFSIVRDVTLYAQWQLTEVPVPATYPVTYHANNGTTDAHHREYEAGTVFSAAANTFSYGGYTFTGWNTQADGSGRAYAEGASLTMTTEGIDLYAQWQKSGGNGSGSGNKGNSGSGTYTVTYRSEYATERVTESAARNTTVTVRDHSILTTAELPEDVQFAGWSLSGSDREVDYQPGDTLRLTSSITLYAVYRQAGESGSGEVEMSGVTDIVSRVAELLNLEDHLAYISGYPDGTVRPQANITREEVAAIFYRLLNNSARSRYQRSTSDFADVETGRWSEAAIGTLFNIGIVTGEANSGFRPGDAITRAEAAVIAAQFTQSGTGGSSVYRGANKFNDINGHWAAEYINIAAEIGWMSGDGTGAQANFRPDEFITRAEMMALVNRMTQRNPQTVSDLLETMINWPDNDDTSAWYYLHVQEATNEHDYERSANGRESWRD